MKNRHHLAAAAEALVKRGHGAKGEFSCKSVNMIKIKTTNHQQEQNLTEFGAKKEETRVEEPDWTDLSRSSKKPGDS